MTPTLITYAQAAQLLTVSVATVRRLCAEGKIKLVILAPRCHRLDGASVQAYIRASVYQPVVPACPSGKTAKPTATGYNGAALSLREAHERAKKRFSSKRGPSSNSQQA